MTLAATHAISRFWQRLGAGGAYPIGLHIGMDHVTLVQMRAQGSGTAIRAAASVGFGCPRSELLADPQRLRTLIKRALADHPFRGRRVVSCLPNDQLKLLVLTYTAAEGEADAVAVERELRARVGKEIEGKVVDFVQVRQRELRSHSNEAIVAMAERERVMAYLDLLSACGLTVEALEIGPVALTRLVSSIHGDKEGEIPNLLLLTFGSRGSYLTVVWGRRLMLDRAVDFAEPQLVSRLTTALDMPEEEARELLLERGFAAGAQGGEGGEVTRMLMEVLRPALELLNAEVAKTLAYAASKTRGRNVDRIYVAGVLARYPGIEEFLSRQFALPVAVLNAFAIFPHALKAREAQLLWPHPGVAAAAGLALRGVPQQWPT